MSDSRARIANPLRPGIAWAVGALLLTIGVIAGSQAISVPPAQAATVSISGTVSFGQAGNHPAGVIAHLTWQRYEDGNWSSRSPFIPTAASGAWALDLAPGRYRIDFSPSSREYQTRYWGGSSVMNLATPLDVGSAPMSGLDITLPPSGEISGRVFLGSAQQPATAGQAKVTLFRCYEDGCVSGGEPTATTDANGGYSFTGLPRGTYTLRTSYLLGTAYQPPAQPITVEVDDTTQRFTGRDIILRAAAGIGGRVYLGADGHTAGAGEVRVKAVKSTGFEESTIATDADGRYLIGGLTAGSYDLFFDYVGAGDFADQWWPGSAVRDQYVTQFQVADTVVERDIRMLEGSGISGTVTNSAGVGLDGIVVTVHGSASFGESGVVTTTTTERGAYSVPNLLAGTYTLDFYAQDTYVQRSLTVTEVGAVEKREVDIVLYRFSMIQGTVTCENCPDHVGIMADFTVSAERDVSLTGTPVWERQPGTSVYPSSDGERGSYQLRPLEPGRYRVSVSSMSSSYQPTQDAPVVVDVVEGQTPTVDIRFRLGAQPVYRFYSPIYRGHFFTTSASERDHILAIWPDIWNYEGQRYTAFSTQVDGTVPLFRFWSSKLGGHFYTSNVAERDQVITTWPDVWSYEGVAYYVYPIDSTVADTVTVARFWSPSAQHHFYTASAAERDHVIRTWPTEWSYEGDNFRVPAAGIPTD